jgi:DNA polymerase (family 10)
MKWFTIINYYDQKILELEKSKQPNDKYILLSYRKFIKILKDAFDNTNKTVTVSDIESLPITDHMKTRLKSFKETPPEEKKQPNLLKIQLSELLGIGNVKADELIAAGLKSISDLKKNKKFLSLLNENTLKFLKYSPDRKIPHENIAKVERLILNLSGKNGVIVGSYRREMPTSRDIDVMIISDDEKILDKFLNKAKTTFGEINVIPYANGPDKLSILIRFNNIPQLKKEKLGVYKLDIFRAPLSKAHAMLLYATGSKDHNILMRKIAKQKNLLLNQDGLYNRETGKLIPTKSERDIFEKLSMEYKEPNQRL